MSSSDPSLINSITVGRSNNGIREAGGPIFEAGAHISWKVLITAEFHGREYECVRHYKKFKS